MKLTIVQVWDILLALSVIVKPLEHVSDLLTNTHVHTLQYMVNFLPYSLWFIP